MNRSRSRAKISSALLLASALPVLAVSPASAETAAALVALGHRIHGEFGSLIALGIRIGQDATRRLGERGRGLDVTYRSGPAAPCSCVVDGVMLATGTSPGQDSLHVGSPLKNAADFAVVTITDKKTLHSVRYTLPTSVSSIMGRINVLNEERRRYDAVMALPARELYRIAVAPQ